MSLTYSGAEPQPSRAMPLPKLAWDFNGTTAPYIGSATGTTTGSAPFNANGKYGQSVILRNDNDASFANSLSYSFTTPVSTATGFTISCWIKFLKLPVGSGVGFNGRMALFTGYPFYFYILNGNYGIYGFYSSYILPGGGNCQTYQTDLTSPSTGVWYHVTYTFGQGASSVYFNGTLKRTETYVGDSTMGGINIANNGIPSDQSGSFELDDLRIYNTALTAAQVQSIYRAQGMPSRVVMSQYSLPSLPGYTYIPVNSLPSSFTLTQTATSNTWTYGSGAITDGGANPALTLVADAPSNLYSAVNPGIWYRLGIQGGTNEYVRHANYVLVLNGYSANNFDFAWAFFLKNGTTNQVKIWNPYPGNGTGYWVQSGFQTAGRIAISTTDPLQAHIYTISVPPSPPSSLTGAPLFNQLSPAARSSAVGAFSLRAVNGVTAKAVQVRAQGQFPPAAMTSDGPQTLTGYSFGGSGSYVASASLDDVFIYQGFNAFDNNIGTWWHSNYPIYNSGTGIYNSGDARASITGGIYAGEWLQIKTPTPILLLSYSLVGRSTFETNRSPRKFWILGSNNDGANWSLVDTQTNINTWASPQVFKTFTISNPGTTYFNTFRIVVNEVGNLTTGASGQDSVQIATWNLVGSPPSQDFYADRLGNLLTAPVTGQSLANWLGGATGYVTTWYDQSGAGQHMNQSTAANQPVLSGATTPASLVFTGTEYFQNTVPFTFNFGSGAFTLRYVASNNTGGAILYKAIKSDFVWNTPYEKKFWLGDGTQTDPTTPRGGYPSQVGNSEGWVISASSIGSTKTSIVHKATSTTAVPIYVNGILQTLATNSTSMGTDPGSWLFIGKAGGTSNYIGNIHEIQIFSTALSDDDLTLIENIVRVWSTDVMSNMPSIIPATYTPGTTAVDVQFAELPGWAPYYYNAYAGWYNFTQFLVAGSRMLITFGSNGGTFIGPSITATGTNYAHSSNVRAINTIDSSNLIYVTQSLPSGTGSITNITYSIPVQGSTVAGIGTTATVTIPYFTAGGAQQGHYLKNGTYSGFTIVVSGNSTYNQSGTTITVTSPTTFTYTTTSTVSGTAPSLTSATYTNTTGMTATPIRTAAAAAALLTNPSYTSNLIMQSNAYWSNQVLVTFSSGHPFMLGSFSWENYSAASALHTDYYGNLITTPQQYLNTAEDFRNVIMNEFGMSDQLNYKYGNYDVYLYNIHVVASRGVPYNQGGSTPGFFRGGTYPNAMTQTAYPGDIGSNTGKSSGGYPGIYGQSDFGQLLHELGHQMQFAAENGVESGGVASGPWWYESICEAFKSLYFKHKNFPIIPQISTNVGNTMPIAHAENGLMTWVDTYMAGSRHWCIYHDNINWTNCSFMSFLVERINPKILGMIYQYSGVGEDQIDTLCRLTGWTITGLFSEWVYWMINLPSVISLFPYPGWGNCQTGSTAPSSPETECFARSRVQVATITESPTSTYVKQRWDQFNYFMPVTASTAGQITTLTPKFQYLDMCGFEVVNISGNSPFSSYTVSVNPVLTDSPFSITGGSYSISSGNIVITGTTVSGTPLLGATMNVSSYSSWGTAGGWAYLSNISGTTYTIAFDSQTNGSPSVTSGTVTTPIVFNTNLNGSSASDWIGVCCSLHPTTGACIRSESQPLAAFTQSRLYTASQIVVFGIVCAKKISYKSGNIMVQFSVVLTNAT